MKILLSVVVALGCFSAVAYADPTCQDGSYYVGDGQCCPDGMVYNGNGTCSVGQGSPGGGYYNGNQTCQDGSYYVGDGQCCPDGMTYNGNGTCSS